MLLKILVVIAVFFGIKTVLKASKIVNEHNQKQDPNNKDTNTNEDIVDAEYTVLKD